MPNSPVHKILIADDEEDMRIFISTVVCTSGYEAITTADGTGALNLARSAAPDLLILDVMMPKIEDGVQTYIEFKSDSNLNRLPIIILSAISEKTFLHYIRTIAQKEVPIPSPDGYMEKPPDASELIQLIESVLAPLG